MRNANTAFMVTPARITIVRFHTGWRSNARAGSIGMADFPPSTPPATPSSSSPAIFTYPPSGRLPRQAPRVRVGGEHRVERRRVANLVRVEHARDGLRDPPEPDPALEEQLHRHLVRRIERGRGGPARRGRRAPEPVRRIQPGV